jgi:hypothetical protein
MIFLDFHKQRVRRKEIAAGTLENFSTIYTATIPSLSQLVFFDKYNIRLFHYLFINRRSITTKVTLNTMDFIVV